jgi:hypothetical protein
MARFSGPFFIDRVAQLEVEPVTVCCFCRVTYFVSPIKHAASSKKVHVLSQPRLLCRGRFSPNISPRFTPFSTGTVISAKFIVPLLCFVANRVDGKSVAGR